MKKTPVKPQPFYQFLFYKQKYILVIVGLLIMAIGYLLMIGGENKDPAFFNEEELYSPIRITIAPILIVGGLILQVVAVMLKPKPQA